MVVKKQLDSGFNRVTTGYSQAICISGRSGCSWPQLWPKFTSTFLVHMVGEFMLCTLWRYHQGVFSGDNRTFLTPFSLVLPRVINTPMALMTTPQNLQGSIILGWYHRTICFPIGPCTFLQMPTKPWGRSSVRGISGPPKVFASLYCFSLPFLIVICSGGLVSLIHSFFFFLVFFATVPQMMALFLWHFVVAAETFNDFSA